MMNRYLISILFLLSCLNYSFSQDWNQVGSDIDGQSAGSRFGQHISINSDGNIVGIGAGTGYVKVYQFLADTQSWSEYGSFTGYTVSLSSNGSIIAVGNSNSNHVKVYQYQASSSSWVQLGSDINGEEDSDNSGRSISLNSDGSIIAIGASSNDGSFNNSGHVRVFQYEGSSSSWVQLGSDIDGEADSDYSGNSVSMNSDGSIVAIGAYQNNGSGNNSGHVRVYKYSNSSWTQLGLDIDGEAANDKSGTSVSINNSGSIVAIGAPFNSGDLGGGHVRVYKWNGTLWSQVGSDLDGKWGDKFGTSLSLNGEGKIISVGSPHFSKGLTEVFQFVDGYWKSMAYLSGEGSFDYSGVATALSGNGSIVATGSDENDGNGNNSGHVRIYKSDALVPDPISVTLNIESDGSYVKSATIKESKSIDIYIVLSERPNAQDITANLSFSGSASISDYTIESSSLIVPYSTLNSYTLASLTLTASQDVEIEGDETLIIDIESVINGVENGTQQVILTIESDTDGDGINDDIDNCPSVANGIPTEGTTVAGGNEAGSAANQLYRPYYITLDASGNLYIADKDNHRIQKWEPGASEGVTVAGGNGIGSAANKLNAPYHITFDASGNMYIADRGNHRIQKWVPGATEGTTVAGGNGEGSAANKLNNPTGIALDASGNLYIADEYNHRVQKWAPGASEGVTVAGGNGEGLAASQLFFPSGIDIDASGNLYIVNYDRILKWVPGATEGTIVAGGNGNGSAANALYYPKGIVFDASGNLYIASSGNDRIQKWAPGASEGVTVAGGNEEGSAANQFNYPTGIDIDASGNLYVSDYNNHRIQKWSQSQLDFDEDGIGDVCDPDIDGDGVTNDLDTCPNTPKGEAVDSNGCSDSQKGTNADSDGDGVTDDIDTCPDTPTGEAVDANGCSDSQKDSDSDGVTDDVDTCPDTPTGEAVDANGCSDSQKDSDSDGVTDDVDTCLDTPTGEAVDANGCSDSQKDTDGDGVTDDIDTCPDTPTGEDVDTTGCSDSQNDSDGDGVTDEVDTCPDTPTGEAVDANGCSDSQKDTDNDGVTDDIDTCPDTPTGEAVDANGCSDSQKDTDGDGVTDDIDTCPDTPTGEAVDAAGCSDSQKDTDIDGVTDDIDTCPDTPTGEAVDANGCSDSQKDTDNDGVTDDIDTCPDTPTGEAVDATGCSDSQKDTDNDGVTDDIDECPSTPTGETVDAKGCALPLFVENISFVKRVYPNPTDNELLVELKENSIVKKVEFVNFSGKQIKPNKVEISKSSIRINVSNFNNGIYLLNISTDKEVNKVKVVIER